MFFRKIYEKQLKSFITLKICLFKKGFSNKNRNFFYTLMETIPEKEVNFMAQTYINGEHIYFAFLAGTKEVTKSREFLNRINVFPVFDSDTGNNLAHTFNYMVDSVKPNKLLGDTLSSLADASLSGARGNSGIIMAQFVNGLAREIGEVKQLSTREFAQKISQAVPYAYEAVSRPVEGTVLTVMREWAEALKKAGEETEDIFKMFLSSLGDARQALQETPNKLKVLKDALVVDAGAQGFVFFLEGIARLVETGNIKELARQKGGEVVIEESLDEVRGEINFRYCSEALLKGNKLDHAELRNNLEPFGDSLIIAGTEEKVKIHLHTNKPDEFFFYLMRYGKILQQKVDDMQRQYQVVHERKNDIALVTDSIADLPLEMIDKYQIHLVPINLEIEGSTFLDKISIKPDQIYSILDTVAEYPTSSQPPLKTVEKLLSFLCEHYKSVIMISVSKELSGTWNVFSQAAKAFQEKGKNISVINSRLNSGAQGLLVQKAAMLIEEGMEHGEIVKKLEERIPDTRIFVSVATFKYMVRGGRLSPMKGLLGKVLNLKPIVSLDEEGRGISFAKAFTRRSNTKKIRSIVKEIQENNPVESYCIVHAGAKEKALSYKDIFTRVLGKEPEYIAEISPIVALSAGIGAVAISLMSSGEKS